MGSVLAIIGDRKDSGLKKQLLRMADRSPHRGTILSHAEDGIVMAVQARGNDASLASVNQHVVAFHGYVGNWHRLGLPDSLGSAAERIAQAYDRLGESLLPKLRGEFALLIYDRSQQILLAARDPVGCRPLFFQRSHDRLFLASEIRQVLAGSDSPRELNRQTLISYLVHQPPADLGTLFRGVQFIAPGEVFRFGCLDATCERQTYWSLEPDSALAGLTPEEWVHELARRLQAAVARSLPEEPFGVSLSGGLDSSAVWASISKLASEGDKRAAMGRPFSLIFPGLDCDESHHISRLLTATNADGLVIDASRIRG
ncbi:MAG: hypothetical protein GY906_35245, partial [bacterium]|nr:hypothetical protein [bacterium]